MADTTLREPIPALTLNIHAMPCTNFCQHCWVQGSCRKRRMPMTQIAFVLDKLAELKAAIPHLSFFFYDEPTNHPHFVDIMEHAARLGLVGRDFFMATNGCLLAHASDTAWERLKRAGVGCLQLTLYGMQATHDAFAGREGAFQEVVRTARRATQHGIGWYAGVIFHGGNVKELAETVAYIRRLDPDGRARVGWFTFLWQGRGRLAQRPHAGDLELLPDYLKQQNQWVTEAEAVRRILAQANLASRRADEAACGSLTLDVDDEMRVYGGGACDSGGIAGALPDLREEFALGCLGHDGLWPILAAYQTRPPRVLQQLGRVTWGELAEAYGDRTSDELYHLPDLPLHKWASEYVLDWLS